MVDQARLKCSLEAPKCLKRRHSAPNLLTTPAPLAGTGGSWSRFSAVDVDSCKGSDDEATIQKDGETEDTLWGSEREFIRGATLVGFSVDELIRAETLFTENIQSPKFNSVDRGQGILAIPGHWLQVSQRQWPICVYRGTGSRGRDPRLSHGAHKSHWRGVIVKDLRHVSSEPVYLRADELSQSQLQNQALHKRNANTWNIEFGAANN